MRTGGGISLERPVRIAVFFSALLLAMPLALAEPEESQQQMTDQDMCPNLEYMDGVGYVCKRGEGYYEFYAPDGRSLGFTHGPDAICVHCDESDMISTTGSTSVHCVSGTSTEYFVRVIYARAYDDTDRYSSMVGTIRNLVGNANAMVDDAAIATGDRLSIRVKCTGGVVDVANEVLPTCRTCATYSTVISDLQGKGYTSHRQKFWVYYDDSSACACAGIGHRYNDDSDSVNNYNNGNSAAIGMFAISFDSNSVRTMLHELGHTLGAVQNSAPYTSGAGHCTDGYDTMCYDDGGPNSGSCAGFYCTGYCSTEVFDCNKNTYCHANPTAGSYLDTHWQACHRETRFLQYAANVAPAMAALSCSPSPSYEGESVTCSFHATDENVGVYYNVAWGDGATTRVPATGTVSPGVSQSRSHVFNEGAYTISVTATDSGTPPATSAAMTFSQTVGPPNDAPTTVSLSCTPTAPAEGDDVTCSVTGTDPTHDVAYSLDWGDGSAAQRLPATGFVASGTTLSATRAYGSGGSFTVSATTTDNGRPPLTSLPVSVTLAVTEINTVPVFATFSCPTAPVQSTATCSFRADDDSPGVRYTVDWGDGSVTYIPSATGYTAPGVSRSATHNYVTDGEYTVSVTVTDDFSPPASASVSATVKVQGDLTGPALSVTEPRNGFLYHGCAQFTKLAGNPLWVRLGCVKATASDPSGVARIEVLYNGGVIASDETAPYVMEFLVPGARVNAPIEVRAVDNKGNTRSLNFRVDMV